MLPGALNRLISLPCGVPDCLDDVVAVVAQVVSDNDNGGALNESRETVEYLCTAMIDPVLEVVQMLLKVRRRVSWERLLSLQQQQRPGRCALHVVGRWWWRWWCWWGWWLAV